MTKEQLRQYRNIKIEISQIERRIAELERLNRDHDKEYVLILQELYAQKLADLIQGQLRIEKAIESLSPIEREVIRLRYIDGVDWTEVSITINYEWAQTHRVHAAALRKLEKL